MERFNTYSRFEVSASHSLTLPYKSKCSRNHGHNYIVEVFITANKLNRYGMIVDFSDIKRIVMAYDHRNLNDTMKVNPTAENLAIHILRDLNVNRKVKTTPIPDNIESIRVRVWEDRDSYAEYVADNSSN